MPTKMPFVYTMMIYYHMLDKPTSVRVAFWQNWNRPKSGVYGQPLYTQVVMAPAKDLAGKQRLPRLCFISTLLEPYRLSTVYGR